MTRSVVRSLARGRPAAGAVALGTLGAALAAVLGAAPAAARAQVPGEVRGRVVDARTNRPVPGARVEAADAGAAAAAPAVAAEDGAFVLRGLEPGAHALRVRAPGYAPRALAVTVANGRAELVRVALDAVARQLEAVRVEAARGAAPAGAIAFDRRALERSGRRDVGELLQTAPGVVVTQSGGPGAPARASIRGSSAGQVLVLVDGVPVNSVIRGDADLSRLSLETVERVTVLPGSQSARYGDRALGGVVLVETRRAGREASALARTGAWGEREAGLTVGAAQEGGTQEGGASEGGQTTRLSGSVSGDRRTVRGDFRYDVPPERGGGSARRLNADSRFTDLVAAGALDGARGAVRARATWQESARGLVGSVVQPSLSGREHGDRASGALDGRWTAGRLAWSGTASLARERAAFADPTPPFGASYHDDVDARAGVATAGVAAPLGPATAEVGAEGRLYEVRSTMLAAGAPGWQHQLGAFGALRAARTLGTAFGAPLELSADAGARLDRNSRVAGTVASPRVGAALAAGRVSVGGSVSSSFAAPTLADQFFHEGVLVRPNPDLRPERVRGELEARAAVRDVSAGPARLEAEASAYRADVDGMILWMPDFRFVWSPTNYDVHRAGWEGAARVALPALGADLRGTLARTDVTYAGPVLAGQVVYRPRTTASVAAGLAPAWLPLGLPNGTRLEAAARYVGARRTVPGYAVNPLAPYWRTDARLAAPFAPRAGWALEATAGVENLFNRPAAMLVDYPFPGRAWSLALRLRRGAARP